MILDAFFARDLDEHSAGTHQLESFHRRKLSLLPILMLAGLIIFVAWAWVFTLDQVARASGEVIASSRVQIIQSVDGGVIESIQVREGDRVQAGQVLARLEQGRIGAAVTEIDARLSALRARAARLRAEVIDADSIQFADSLRNFPEILQVEQALFTQRRQGLQAEEENLQTAIRLAREEFGLVQDLARSGDVNRSEVIRTERALNETESALINRRNRYYEEARTALAEAEDAIAQNEQILLQRQQQLDDSIFVAKVPGVVKNIRVTTVGGVLGAGEELMQIIPVDDELLIEAKIRPADIAQLRTGLQATVRFDPYDYTIYGGVIGEVVYVSADTLKEQTSAGEEIYYRVQVRTATNPAVTTTGRQLDILPGMTAQVDIKTGQRTLLDYLLKPLRKTLSESLGER